MVTGRLGDTNSPTAEYHRILVAAPHNSSSILVQKISEIDLVYEGYKENRGKKKVSVLNITERVSESF